ncbi:MAG TPA: NepR family anti-sigma factor [Sphingomicrobium sp.]|nr:NepR family anti-sigma factor [Sphingomicrobium sp.]
MHFGTVLSCALRPKSSIVRGAWTRARGDERLSGTKRGKSGGAGRKNGSGKPPNPPKKKQRTSDIGRALRSIYDDTLRESVPDEFTDLLGKLS